MTDNEEKTTDDRASVRYYKNARDKYAQATDVILKLSTGALALSITFRQNLVTESTTHTLLLQAAWVSLAVVPFTYVLNLLNDANHHAFLWQKSSGIRPYSPFLKFRHICGKTRPFLRIEQFLLNAGFSAFFSGIMFLLLFALNNINH